MNRILRGAATALVAFSGGVLAQPHHGHHAGCDKDHDGKCDVTGQVIGRGAAWLAASRKVDLNGSIERVHLEPGTGMPYFDLRTEKGTHRVFLGSMRYLIEKNFKPAAGDSAVVKGFLVNQDVFARSVELPAAKVVIQLRDENGLPLWRMGPHHGQRW